MATMRLTVIIACSVLTAVTAPAPTQAAGELPSIEWAVGRVDDNNSSPDLVQFKLSYRSGKGESQTSRSMPLSELQGLTQAQLASSTGTPARFRFVRQAGILDCEGIVRRQRGAGECRFAPDAGFAAALDRQGIGRPTPRQQLDLAIHGGSLDVAKELERQGYTRPSIDDLVKAGIFNVDVAYLRSLGAAGYRAGNLDRLVEMRIHGVDIDYVRSLAAIGPNFQRLPVSKLVEMRIHGVKPADVRELAQLGYGDLTPNQLVEMRIHGVTPAYVREMAAAGYRRLTPGQLVSMRIHGVTGEMAKRANTALRTRN